MKRMIVEDGDGKLQAFWVRDTDTGIEHGIPDSPPDLDRLDWDEIKRELNNHLVTERFTTWHDVQLRQDLFTGLVLSVVRNRIVNLYKLAEQELSNAKKGL